MTADANFTEPLRKLLTSLELPTSGIGKNVRLHGADPVVPSRYPIGLVSASALAANAVGIMEIAKMRGGPEQTADIDLLRAAVPGLRTLACTSRGGRKLSIPWPPHEKQVFFRTKDGRMMYLMRHGVYYHHLAKLLTFLDASPDSTSIAKAVAKWNSVELEEALAERSLMGTIVRTRAEWLASPQGKHLQGKIPVEIEKIGDSAPMPFTPAERPLAGIKVIDMAHVLAGPVTSRIMAEQGAKVLHVNSPQQPDPVHTVIDTGFGKRSAFIDMDRPQDVDTLNDLIKSADVFAHSWRPGSLDRRGLSPAELAKKRPGMIYVSVSCYGYDGPWAQRAGYDPLGQVSSGYAAGEGSTDAPIMASTFTLNDYLAAYAAAAGVNAALIKRAKFGGSYHVKASLTAASMWVMEFGEMEKQFWSDGPKGVPVLPEPRPEHLTMTRTPFGDLEHPLPIVDYSHTKGRWDLPPEPLGASAASWDF
jgi:crotonobetainyl-CoA:carnitine CoA-transferase CaiB-like acyl-CoA transferase